MSWPPLGFPTHEKLAPPLSLIAVNCRALAPTKTHCVRKILNGDETSKAELPLVLRKFSTQSWR